MVRFSCFNAHLGCQKPKKTVQPSIEAMHKTIEDISQFQASKGSNKAAHLESFLPQAEAIAEIHDSEPVKNSSAVFHSWKPEEMKNIIDLDTDTMVHQKGQYLKKSRSLGSRLFLEGRVPGKTDVDDGTDQGFSSDSHDHGLLEADGSKLTIVSQKALCAESVQESSNDVNDEPIFTIGDPQHSEKDGHDNSDVPLSGEGANGSGELTPRSAPVIVKSCSMPNIVASEITSGRQSPFKYLTNNPRSCEDVHVLNMRRKEISVHEVDTEVMREGDDIHKNHKSNMENSYYDGYDSYRYSASAKDWIVPVSDEVNSVKILQEDLPVPDWNEVTGKDFMIQRIEDWVNDLQHCSPLEETCELSHPSDHVKEEPIVSNALTATKVDTKVTPGMEAAKRYISSLSASATTAQLANHGLAVIPFLSAFVSLKVLNLSGNAISRIAAGALPRGLHMLNLSKNNISTIEGLRELTRLRVLDLSYNRIVRISHGLASCSSLKELYLAGNKISEVEGLHRLLKLTVLDLRFNKISTAKCLGQLAANYNSLQAISLEGNPAQKNVGDEHLKKYLQGLLPHLVYYNRQAIKVSTLKDAAERSVRLGISADRGLRSENKATRKSNHGSATHRPSSSSTHAHRATASPRHSRGRNVRLPPSGTKATSNQRNFIDLGSKILNLKSELSMRRTRSEGNLGPL